MTPRTFFVSLLAIVSLGFTAGADAQQLPPNFDDPAARDDNRIRVSRAGFVEVNTKLDSGMVGALAGMARRHDRIVLWCGSLWGASGAIPGVIEVPDSRDGMAALAAAYGRSFAELEPGVDVVHGTDAAEPCPPFPVILTLEPVAGMGGAVDPTIPLRDFERQLFQEMPIPISWNLYHYLWEGLHYWPTREGAGREFYVVSHSSDALSPKSTPLRGVKKYELVDDDRRGFRLRRLWAVAVPGPVATVELDFDEDGVIDVVAFSGFEGNEVGTTPLVIVSGRTGERLGEIEGDELVVTRSKTGVKVRTLGTRQDVVAVSDSTYWVETRIQRLYVLEEGELALAWEREEPGYCALGGPLEPRTQPRDFRVPDIGRPRAADKPLLRPKRETEDLASLAPGEQLLAHVLVADARVLPCFNRGPWHGIAALGRVGEQILWPGRDAPELANTRILFEYHPPKREEHREP